jgi:hypothetical protein
MNNKKMNSFLKKKVSTKFNKIYGLEWLEWQSVFLIITSFFNKNVASSIVSIPREI